MHVHSDLPIFYFGTPVVLISSRNVDGSHNIAPFSSIFWLMNRCVIGVSHASQTAGNLLREQECVLNMPSAQQVGIVNALAKTTGRNPVPSGKISKGYVYHGNKAGLANLQLMASETVSAARIKECPVQLEAKLRAVHGLGDDDIRLRGRIMYAELEITKTHIDPCILWPNNPNRVDPDVWKPLIMSFQEFYTTGEKLAYSRLAEIPEQSYAIPKLPVVS